MDADSDQRAADDGNRVDVGNLPARVENRHQEEPGEPADKRCTNYLEGDHRATFRALIGIGEMPLTALTGGHQEWVRTLRTQ